MNVCIATEQRFIKVNDSIYTIAISDSKFWGRYLDVFNKVYILARVKELPTLPSDALQVDRGNIHVIELDYYIGPFQFLIKLPSLWKKLDAVVKSDSAYILRIPGVIGSLLYFKLKLQKNVYGAEVVGDPSDSLSKNAIGGLWPYLVRGVLVKLMVLQCENADAISYVTKNELQKRYPNKNGFKTYYSSIELNDSIFERGNVADNYVYNGCLKCVFVGSLEQKYKGLHVLLSAIKMCADNDIDVQLTVLGDGRYREHYVEMMNAYDLNNLVKFVGNIKQGDDVFSYLRRSDIFIMPSLMEGLPRALIEAMSVGLYCIGTNIGGIPELLRKDDIVAAGDEKSLYVKILQYYKDPLSYKSIRKKNVISASAYKSSVLRKRRNNMYSYLKKITAKFNADRTYN